MFYDLPLYRPPSEGSNLIIQATYGCSYNRCAFCSMYRSKTFTARPLADVFADIDMAARAYPQAHRVFLADGDALVLPTDHLLQILAHLKNRLPNLARVSSYALPANLLKKSEQELAELRAAGLTLIYYGIETGNRELLRRIRKGASPEGMIKGLNRAAAAGMKISATVILGLGGKHHWEAHARDTAALVNAVPLTYLSTLQLGLEPEVAEAFFARFDPPFVWQDDAGMLREQITLISEISPPKPVIFRSNHASNALPLKGVLPKDKDRLCAELEAALSGQAPIVPPWMRGF